MEIAELWLPEVTHIALFYMGENESPMVNEALKDTVYQKISHNNGYIYKIKNIDYSSIPKLMEKGNVKKFYFFLKVGDELCIFSENIWCMGDEDVAYLPPYRVKKSLLLSKGICMKKIQIHVEEFPLDGLI